MLQRPEAENDEDGEDSHRSRPDASEGQVTSFEDATYPIVRTKDLKDRISVALSKPDL
jgi:hypothetical protein